MDRLKLKLGNYWKPIGTKPLVMIFYGPLGCGISHLAKLVAKILFESRDIDDRYLYLDCSTFKTPEGVNTLAGAPLQYAGGRGALYEAVEKAYKLQTWSSRPTRRVRSAHQDFISSSPKTMFQTKGVISSNSGHKLFKNEHCVFICTMNADSEEEVKNKLGGPTFSRLQRPFEFREVGDTERDAMQVLALCTLRESIESFAQIWYGTVPSR